MPGKELYVMNMHCFHGCYLIDLEEAIDLATLILLLLHFLTEALSLALLNGVGCLKGPATATVCLTHIITRVTAPKY